MVLGMNGRRFNYGLDWGTISSLDLEDFLPGSPSRPPNSAMLMACRNNAVQTSLSFRGSSGCVTLHRFPQRERPLKSTLPCLWCL